LELEPVEASYYIAVQRLQYVTKDMTSPSVGVGSSEVSASDLLKHISHMERFQQGQIGWFLAKLFSNFRNKVRPWNCPFIGDDGAKKRWESILMNSIQQE